MNPDEKFPRSLGYGAPYEYDEPLTLDEFEQYNRSMNRLSIAALAVSIIILAIVVYARFF